MLQHVAPASFPQDRISPELFNLHVADELLAVVRAWACLIRCGVADYSEGLDWSLEHAWKRGAWGFSAVHLGELQDWIAAQLRLALGEW